MMQTELDRLADELVALEFNDLVRLLRKLRPLLGRFMLAWKLSK